MKLDKYFKLLLVFFVVLNFHAQEISKRYDKINWFENKLTLEKPKLLKKLVAPVSLMALGLSLNSINTKTIIQEGFRKPFNNFETKVDDVLPLVPVGIMYSADLLKLKARNSVWNQTKYLAISEITSVGIVLILKNTLKILRPDSSTYNSFPSGHTTIAFTSSQVLFNEFYQTNKIIACSGLLFSMSTGSLRVINNRHWVPDVLMGAGIGILVTNLVYHFEPLKNWNPWKKWNKNLSFQPSIGTDYLGANFNLKL